jgi:tetratricopeptide (TPR) repeat protein
MRIAALAQLLSLSCAMSFASRCGIVGGVAFGLLSGGCGGERAGDLLVQAGDAYGEAQYGRAVDCARRASKTSQGIARDQANYIEGLGEWKLGRLEEGAALFSKVAQSSDRELAADALVSLGSLEIERKQFDAAGRAYARAAESFEGTERRRAFGVALRCYERAGLSVEADKLRTKAGLPPTDRELAAASGVTSARRAQSTSDTAEGIETTQKSPAASQTPPSSSEVAQRNGLVSKGAPSANGGGNGSATRPLANAPQYAIQAGAFSDADRARAVSREVAKRAQAGGQAGGQASADASENLGSPRVVEKVSAGKTIYVVQIGRFANRSEAAKAMRRFDKLGYTVEPFAE